MMKGWREIERKSARKRQRGASGKRQVHRDEAGERGEGLLDREREREGDGTG